MRYKSCPSSFLFFCSTWSSFLGGSCLYWFLVHYSRFFRCFFLCLANLLSLAFRLKSVKRENIVFFIAYILIVINKLFIGFVYRAIFNRVSKVIRDSISFALLRSVIGLENSQQSLSQSDVKLKPIATWSLTFSRA